MDVPGIGNIYQGPGAGGSEVGLRALWEGEVAGVWRRETRRWSRVHCWRGRGGAPWVFLFNGWKKAVELLCKELPEGGCGCSYQGLGWECRNHAQLARRRGKRSKAEKNWTRDRQCATEPKGKSPHWCEKAQKGFTGGQLQRQVLRTGGRRNPRKQQGRKQGLREQNSVNGTPRSGGSGSGSAIGRLRRGGCSGPPDPGVLRGGAAWWGGPGSTSSDWVWENTSQLAVPPSRAHQHEASLGSSV